MELYLDNAKRTNRKEKGRILDELCTASGYHKKHAIRVLNTPRRSAKEKRGRPEKQPSSIYQMATTLRWCLW